MYELFSTTQFFCDGALCNSYDSLEEACDGQTLYQYSAEDDNGVFSDIENVNTDIEVVGTDEDKWKLLEFEEIFNGGSGEDPIQCYSQYNQNSDDNYALDRNGNSENCSYCAMYDDYQGRNWGCA